MPSRGRLVRTLLISAALLLGATVTATAQDGGSDGAGRIDYAAYLQAGTCERPGDPIAALAGTSTSAADRPRTDLDAPAAPLGSAIPASVSVTNVERSLDALLQGELIVRVVESADEPETTIACGSIAGEPDDDGNLYLALTEQADSGVTGVVWLQRDGDATTVTVFLIPSAPSPTAVPSNQG